MVPKRRRLGRLAPLIPALVLVGFFIAALSALLLESVKAQPDGAWSLQHYRRFLSDPFYLAYLVRSNRVALAVTLAALLVGYPTAYAMARGPAFVRRALSILLLFQFFSVTVTRVYAFLLILGDNGLINRGIRASGFTTEHLSLVNNEAGVLIGLVAAALPLAVVPIFSTLMGIQISLDDAATTLGAGRLTVFWRIVFPLSLPGVGASAVLVYLYSLGAFLTPSLIGGGFVDLIAAFAYDQAMLLSNPGFAAAGTTLTLISAFVMVLVMQRLFQRLTRNR